MAKQEFTKLPGTSEANTTTIPTYGGGYGEPEQLEKEITYANTDVQEKPTDGGVSSGPGTSGGIGTVNNKIVASKTISYSEKDKGWKTFNSFIPDAMGNVSGKFFSVKNGQLYSHNEQGPRNNFYGEQFTSKISTVLNHDSRSDKVYKTIFQEGSDSWNVSLKTNLANGTISKEEFNKRQSIFYAHIRGNEDENDLNGAVQGIGTIESFTATTLTFSYPPELLNIGNDVHQLVGEGGNVKIGTITEINGNVIKIFPTGVQILPGAFCFEKRNARVDGGDIRGYYLRVDLENDSTKEVELFAVGCNAIKSHP